MGNNPNLDCVNINASTKFGQIMFICSKDIERKQILKLIKGHYSVTDKPKMAANNPNLDPVNMNEYIKIAI